MDGQQLIWFVAVLGFVILGAAIAYGLARTPRRSPAERKLTAEGTQRVYREEEKRPGPD